MVKLLMTGCAGLVCADTQQSKRGVVKMILELPGRARDAYHQMTDRVGQDLPQAMDSAKLRSELGWQETYPEFAGGLAQTTGRYRVHKACWRPPKAATENAYAVQSQ